MQTRIETISPSLASKYLAKNTNNRTISEDIVNRYAKSMLTGAFKQAGDSIKFDVTGRLLDGQHRLQAIIKSGMPQTFIIVEGLEPEAFDCIDIGKKRTATDCLTVLKCKNAARTAAALKILLLLRESKQLHVTLVRSHDVIPHTKIIELFEREPLFEEFISNTWGYANNLLQYTGAGLLGLFFDCWKENQSAVNDFFLKASKGADLHEDHPILYLRNYLIRDSMSNTRLPIGMRFWLVVKIWEDYRQGRETRKLISLPGYTSTTLIPLVV